MKGSPTECTHHKLETTVIFNNTCITHVLLLLRMYYACITHVLNTVQYNTLCIETQRTVNVAKDPVFIDVMISQAAVKSISYMHTVNVVLS